MAAKKSVNDVTKPGSTPADETSRPIITKRSAIIRDPMVQEEQKVEDTTEQHASPLISKKVIAPPVTDQPELPVEALPAETKAEVAPDESKSSEPDSTPEPQTVETSPEPAAPTEEIVLDEVQPVSKQAEKKEQEPDYDKVTDTLVAQKKYFVPINVAKHRNEQKHSYISLALFVILLVALVAVVDLGVVDVGMQLPFDFL